MDRDLQEPRPSVRVNIRLAVALVLIAGLGVGGIYFLHAWQIRRSADSMLARAKLAEAKGDLVEAMRHYRYYASYRPEDQTAGSKLAMLAAARAKKSGAIQDTQDAFRMLERAGTRDSGNLDMIRELAYFAMKVGRYDSAAKHYARLSKEFPAESGLFVKLGRAQQANERHSEAIASFAQAIAADQRDLEGFSALADIYRELDDREEGDAVINQMVSANAENPMALIHRAKYWFLNKDPDAQTASVRDVTRALASAPKDLDVLLGAVGLAMARRDVKEADRLLKTAESVSSEDPRVKRCRIDYCRLTDDKEGWVVGVRDLQDESPESKFELLEAELHAKNLDEAERVLDRIRAGFRPEIGQYYEARLAIEREEWKQAVRILERLLSATAGNARFQSQVNQLLGACHQKLGRTDQQTAAFRRALEEDPSLMGAQAGLALALMRSGKSREALVQFRNLREIVGREAFLTNKNYLLPYYQLVVSDVRRKPVELRDFSEAEQLLKRIEQVEGFPRSRLGLLQSELLLQQGNREDAFARVEELFKDYPDDLQVCSAWASVAMLSDGPAAGLKVLDETGQRLGDSLGLRLAQANLAVRLERQAAVRLLDQLGQKTDGYSPAEMLRLRRTLALAYYYSGDAARAWDAWRQVAKLAPEDVNVLLTLFDLARVRNDEEGIIEMAAMADKLVGPNMPESNYCHASRIVWEVRKNKKKEKRAKLNEDDRSRLGDAKRRLASAMEKRPAWHDLPRLAGEIAVLEERLEEAVDLFQRANTLGQLSPVHLTQLARLLTMMGRYEEADRTISQLGQTSSRSTVYLVTEIKRGLGQTQEAIDLAKQLAENSSRAVDYLWVGQLCAHTEDYEGAEKAFRRAAELNPRLPHAWLGIMAVLKETNKIKEAEEVLREAQIKLPQDVAPLVLGQCYEILGNKIEAERYFLDAVGLQPDDLAILRRVVDFYVRIPRPQEARQYLTKIIRITEKEPTKHADLLRWSRRTLAQVLAQGADWRGQQQALGLLQQNAIEGRPDVADLRLESRIHARRSERSSRVKAITVLERIFREYSDLNPDDQLLLGQLYHQTNRWALCREQMISLLAERPSEPRILIPYIEMLLERSVSPSEIAPWMSRLESARPDEPRTVALRARMLINEGKAEEAVKHIETLIQRPLPEEAVGRLVAVARMLEQLEQIEPARKHLIEFSRKAPGGKLPLAEFLGRHGTIDEALDACREMHGEVPIWAVAPVGVNILRAQLPSAKDEHHAMVAGWLDEALKEHPDSREIQLQWALFQELEGNYEEVIELYEKFLERTDLGNEQRALVQNNLAYVLAANGSDPERALELINQAINTIGPTPAMLDTRGLAHLAREEFPLAMEDFRSAVSDQPSGVKYFHLALAHLATGDRHSARRSLETARQQHQFSIQDLPVVEHDRHRRLIQALDGSAARQE